MAEKTRYSDAELEEFRAIIMEKLELAQRDYDISIVKRAEERIKAIERFLEAYDKTCLKKLYHKTNSYRKELITPAVFSDEEFIRQWQSIEYKGRTFEDDENITISFGINFICL